MIITEITGAAVAIGTWVMKQRELRQQRDDAAIKTVLVALTETESYISEWNAGRRDRAREARLVTLWTDAAVAIRRKDKDLAQRLEVKAQYWADPENWSGEQVERAGIQINVVAADARALLAGN